MSDANGLTGEQAVANRTRHKRSLGIGKLTRIKRKLSSGLLRSDGGQLTRWCVKSQTSSEHNDHLDLLIQSRAHRYIRTGEWDLVWLLTLHTDTVVGKIR